MTETKKDNSSEEMTIQEMEVMPKTGETAAPTGVVGIGRAPNPLAALNDEFSGIGTTGWAKRIVPEGNQIMFKDRTPQTLVDSLTVRLLGGRAVKTHFIEETQTMIKSYDGVRTTDGESVTLYPQLRDCMEIDFMYDSGENEGEEVDHQAVLSPTSRYAFDDYAAKLKKLDRGCINPAQNGVKGVKITEVDTIITVVRAVSKQNIRYSKFQFTCKELGGLPVTAEN
jgi:hypothetical protein